MKRLLFVLLLMVCSVSWAGWERVGSHDVGVVYADRATIRKKGNFIEMWRMENYFEIQVNSEGKKYKSSKIFDRFDCNNETYGIVSFSQHSGEYGRGETVFSYTPKKNEIQDDPISPESIGESLWQVACGRK